MGTPLNGEISLFFISQFLTPKWVPVHPALFEKRKLIVGYFLFSTKTCLRKTSIFKVCLCLSSLGFLCATLELTTPAHTSSAVCFQESEFEFVIQSRSELVKQIWDLFCGIGVSLLRRVLPASVNPRYHYHYHCFTKQQDPGNRLIGKRGQPFSQKKC